MFYLILSLLHTFSLAATAHPSAETWHSIKTVKYANEIEYDDVELFIPTDIPESIDNSRVGKKVMDHTLSNFVKGEMTPEAEIFKTVKRVEEKVKYDIEIPAKNKNDVNHKFNLQYTPFQNIAKIRYSGFFNANLEYDLDESFVYCTIEKTLNKDTYLAFVQSKDPYSENRDSLSMINLKFSWN